MNNYKSLCETEKKSYNELYKDKVSDFINLKSEEYIVNYERYKISPFYHGGHTKGYVRGLAVQRLLNRVSAMGIKPKDVSVLDAGCGQGELSVYLACKGFRVIGVDISHEACTSAEKLAIQLGVLDQCTFLPQSLEHISIPDKSINFVIGHAALHHFIKYRDVPKEFLRIMTANAEGFFADSFGENRFYNLYHNKRKMQQLGDVVLTKALIEEFFSEFDVKITPTDWLVMLDKLYLKFTPARYEKIVRKLSKLHFYLDRKMPVNSRLALAMSGAVLTIIEKRHERHD